MRRFLRHGAQNQTVKAASCVIQSKQEFSAHLIPPFLMIVYHKTGWSAILFCRNYLLLGGTGRIIGSGSVCVNTKDVLDILRTRSRCSRDELAGKLFAARQAETLKLLSRAVNVSIHLAEW